jgi:LacI family gluconate utilization system Gnt-I transcriptional repressor
VPGDIGIAGWGDLPVTSVLPKRLTSVHVPHLKLGQAAAEMMIARLSGEAATSSRAIDFHLIPGATVRQKLV